MPARGWSLKARPEQILAVLGMAGARKAALLSSAVVLQSAWKQVLNTPGGGKTRKVTKGGATHTASSPGDAPAPDLGELKRSISVVDTEGEIRVGTGLRYGLALEFGVNVAGSRVGPHPSPNFEIQPRPHARPAFVKAKRKMSVAMAGTLKARLGTPSLS